MMVYYARNTHDFALKDHSWKITNPGKAARYYEYDGATFTFDGLKHESLTPFREATVQETRNVFKALFGAIKVRRGLQ